jgi:glutathione peroxidase
VIDKNGQVVAFFPSKVKPDDPELRAAIDKALGE